MSPIQSFYVPASNPYKGYSQIFTSSGTWTCPVGVTDVEVFAVGGGGGAGGVNWPNSGTAAAVSGGGGGGQVIKRNITVVPNTTYNIYVGAGGAGGYSSFPGQMGGYSGFNNSYTLINGIMQQPYGNSNYFRYSTQNSSYTTLTTSSIPYNDVNSWNYTSTNFFYAGSTNIKNNTATTNGDPTKTIYLNSNGSYPTGTYFWVPVKPSTQYTASGYFALDHTSSTANGAIRILWYSSLYGSNVSTTDGVSTSFSKTWTRISNTATSPANATYALVHYQFISTSSAYLSGPQFEEGTLTSFKSAGFNSTSGRVIQNLGFVTEGSSTVIAGGGGGGQTYMGQSSQSWYNNSYVLRPEYSGVGGGSAYSTSPVPMIGGNGASYNGRTGNKPTLHIDNYTVTSTSIGTYEPYIQYEGLGSGGNAYYRAGTNGNLYLESPEPGYDGIYGAGGLGGRYSVSGGQDISLTGLSLDTRNALPNTGSGGSGGTLTATTSYTQSQYGGAGGSGIVILKWLGQ